MEEAQRAGTTLPKLSDLGYGAYERLNSPSRVPAGCTPEACPCRGQALDGYSNEVVAICTDPQRYRKLKAADTRAANAERQAQRDRALARLDAHLEGLTEPAQVTGREVAVLALLALQTVHGAGTAELLRTAVRRHGGDGPRTWRRRSSPPSSGGTGRRWRGRWRCWGRSTPPRWCASSWPRRCGTS